MLYMHSEVPVAVETLCVKWWVRKAKVSCTCDTTSHVAQNLKSNNEYSFSTLFSTPTVANEEASHPANNSSATRVWVWQCRTIHLKSWHLLSCHPPLRHTVLQLPDQQISVCAGRIVHVSAGIMVSYSSWVWSTGLLGLPGAEPLHRHCPRVQRSGSAQGTQVTGFVLSLPRIISFCSPCIQCCGSGSIHF